MEEQKHQEEEQRLKKIQKIEEEEKQRLREEQKAQEEQKEKEQKNGKIRKRKVKDIAPLQIAHRQAKEANNQTNNQVVLKTILTNISKSTCLIFMSII